MKTVDEIIEILNRGDTLEITENIATIKRYMEELTVLRFESEEWTRRYDKKLDAFANDGIKALSTKMGELVGLMSQKMQAESELPKQIALNLASEKTGLPECVLKKLCYENKINYVQNGRKIYINEQSLVNYLNSAK